MAVVFNHHSHFPCPSTVQESTRPFRWGHDIISIHTVWTLTGYMLHLELCFLQIFLFCSQQNGQKGSATTPGALQDGTTWLRLFLPDLWAQTVKSGIYDREKACPIKTIRSCAFGFIRHYFIPNTEHTQDRARSPWTPLVFCWAVRCTDNILLTPAELSGVQKGRVTAVGLQERRVLTWHPRAGRNHLLLITKFCSSWCKLVLR